jgi:hypothetical protein
MMCFLLLLSCYDYLKYCSFAVATHYDPVLFPAFWFSLPPNVDFICQCSLHYVCQLSKELARIDG